MLFETCSLKSIAARASSSFTRSPRYRAERLSICCASIVDLLYDRLRLFDTVDAWIREERHRRTTTYTFLQER
jgi:hypothetical protein